MGMTTTVAAETLVSELQTYYPLVEAVPDPLAGPERRAEVRYETLADPIELDLLLADGRTLRALLSDISPAGARVIADRLPPSGQTVRLVFTVADRRFDVSGDVLYVGGDDERHYFAVQFARHADSVDGPRAWRRPAAGIDM
jgi:hypothetical protein